MSKNNIILIGMPGVGKSSAGVVLAKAMGYSFVDSDIIIQEREGRLLKDIIAEDGIEGFIKIENEVNSTLDMCESIIATGGSVVYGEEAMQHLREIGCVVYLRVSFEEIDSRLGCLVGRGVVLKEGQTLKDLYEERSPLYEKYADIVVDEDGQTIRETVENVIDELKRIGFLM